MACAPLSQSSDLSSPPSMGGERFLKCQYRKVKLYDDLFGEIVRLKMEKGRYRKALKEMGIIKKGEH